MNIYKKYLQKILFVYIPGLTCMIFDQALIYCNNCIYGVINTPSNELRYVSTDELSCCCLL